MKQEIIVAQIEKLVQDDVIPGASFAFVTATESQSFVIGDSQVQPTREPLQQNMLYDLASVTKVVGTTTRIFQLIAQGKLTFDTKVAKLLPRFKLLDVTLKDLLLHQAGLPGDFSNKHQLSQADLIEAIYQCEQPIYPIGSQTLYSDIGYILLGWIIEVFDGSLGQGMQKFIFEPLEMTNTGYHLAQPLSRFVPTECTKERGCIRGKCHDHKAFLLAGESGSAGLFSTLTDLIHFVQMMLNQGCYQGKEVLSSVAFDWLKEYQQGSRTLGWEVLQPDIYYHTGFTGTSLLVDMKRQNGFILLTNRIHPSRDNQAFVEARKEIVARFIS
ncbi:serine hydrolase domain-containing protein [Isobaculum melis]|uniref:CubicO group peptidase, beta-lactamase class C family n=1 Tax=Isobaculum melis TaxID=142588 RepID=A0A1H9PQB8_9LACT|nr:serine hydrolase domain-containing protein [Isobaculum melis]SER49753.1 CubicO group peptidase, beta-lactamase class C family [Isobaculum melis]